MSYSNQSLRDIINELPEKFVNEIMQEHCIISLKMKLKNHRCYNRQAVIKARIERLTYLVA